ncbi:MAG: methyltransferase domain-containing protein [Chloroflexaceae bacterium]|nr:methyltransferase domain-containing protein [Chloroflexaceae bacterium]
MPSFSYDRAVAYYDATRSFADGVAEQIRDAILAQTQTTHESRLLELGVGTGRIALPFAEAGYHITGIDISLAMMREFVRKLAHLAPPLTCHLCQADITHLPFADATFDVVLAVHVLHLVDGWQQAIHEARRVTRKPGGLFLVLYDGPPVQTEGSQAGQVSPIEVVRQKWRDILKELGEEYGSHRPGLHSSDERVGHYLRETGAEVATINLTEYEYPSLSPRDVVEHIRQRTYSADWHIPDAVHSETVRQLEAWLPEAFDEPDRPMRITGTLNAVVARWPG